MTSALAQSWQLFQSYRKWRDSKKIKKRMKALEASTVFDTGGLATLEDAANAGLLQQGERSLYLGLMDGNRLFFNGEGPLLTYGYNGSGKGRDVIMPNLAHISHSVFCTDPKGENAFACHEHRAQTLGQPVAFVNPWNIRGLPNHRINPLQGLIDKAKAKQRIVDDAQDIAQILIPNPEQGGQNAWIQEGAQELLYTVLVFLAEEEPDYCTLGQLWDIANSTTEAFDSLLDDMAASQAGNGLVQLKAKKLASTYPADKEARHWIKDAMDKAVKLYAPGSELRASTEKSDFEVALLKQRPSTVFLMVPGKYLESAAQWLALLTNYAIETVAQTQGKQRCTFLLDEFANLPKMPSALKALRLYRSAGVQLWPFVQGRQSLTDAYGTTGQREFEDQAHIVQMWGVEDYQLLTELETKVGNKTVVTQGASLQAALQGSGESINEQAVPRLPKAEIRLIDQGEQLLMIRGALLMRAQREAWWNLDPWSSQIKNTFTDQ